MRTRRITTVFFRNHRKAKKVVSTKKSGLDRFGIGWSGLLREAKSTATLNRSNIAHLDKIGDHNGRQGD